MKEKGSTKDSEGRKKQTGKTGLLVDVCIDLKLI